MKLQKKFILFGLFCLFLSLFNFPNLSLAQESTNNVIQTKYIETTSETDIFDKDQKTVGTIHSGIQLSIDNITDGKAYFQWDGGLAYIDEKNTNIVNPENITFTPVNVATAGVIGKILTHTNVEVYSDVTKTPIMQLAPGVEYSVTKSDGEYFTIIVGNRLGLVKIADVELMSTTNDSSSSANGSSSSANGSSSSANDSSTSAKMAATVNNSAQPSLMNTQTNAVSTNVVTPAATAKFLPTDRFFQANEDNIAIYDNSSGSLVKVGSLTKGQIYPRVSDYGDWHQIKFGNGYGYVWKGSTIPASSDSIKNLNKGLSNTNRYFTPKDQLSVYDNSSGSLVPFASLDAKINYPIISDDGDWYQIDVSGRIGYVYKPSTTRAFVPSDRFFQVTDDNVGIYDNSSGSLVQVGTLVKGQVYPRVADDGDWHQVKFGNGFGYVYKGSTSPVDSANIKNINPGLSNQNQYFIPKVQLSVFDNTSGSLVPFASLKAGMKYPIISVDGDWYQIDVSGRIGYVYKPSTTRAFLPTDRFFQVTDDNVGIYDNSSGSLVQVGTLVKGQVYPRVADDGDWHQVKFGNGFGYIYKGSTSPVDSANIKNINPGLSNRNQYFIPKAQLSVFDNSSGSLVPFASLNAGMKYPIISVDGDWYQIDVSGRIGYVYRPSTTMPFASTDKYFQVTEDNVGIYDNSTGSLVQVGTLTKGQVYPRISDYGDWHQIRFGNKYGYVWKGSTSVPDNVSLKNENTSGTSNSNLYFTPLQDVTVFDNTSGSLVPFGTINKGTLYQAICVIGDWLQVDLSGRIGYVYKGSVQLGPTTIDNYRNYNYSLDQFLSTQMAAVPQTDMYKNSPAYISKDYVSYMSDANHSPGYYVTADSLNVRELPNSNAGTFIYGTLKKDTQVTVLEDANGWYRILYTWRNAKSADTLPYLDPSLNSKFQHLRLDIPANISADGLNKVLTGKGILSGKGQSFKDAALKYGLNEVYLISHAMLETGNGTSTLASGVPIKVNNGVVTIVDPKNTKPDYTVYNMYGIGAKDSCALQCGVQTAYDKGWFTPELAIVYGAEFVKTDYVGIGQNTLFKMRWNPDFIYVKNGVVYNNYPELSSAIHQYATDIGWAAKQAKTMESMYNQFDYYNAVFDIPIFK